MREILESRYKDLWYKDRRGAHTLSKHDIRLSTNRPLAVRPRRFTEEQAKVIEDEIDNMLKDNVIKKSSSNYATEIVLVLKPNKTWRVCMDYRLLNQYTIPDQYSLPNLQDLVRAVRGSSYFVTLDLRAGYWQILMT